MKKAFTAALLFFAFSLSYSQTFSLTGTQFKVGSFYRTYSILFSLGKSELRPNTPQPILDSVVTFLKNNPTIQLEMDVHADSRLSDRSNTNLTLARAKSILDYLVNKGIEASRLKAAGYGKKKLLITDSQIAKAKTVDEKEALHAQNRRVEFKIIAL
ncbi:MAG: hypothetical protein JWP12_79 [Bacteroidetes bacterium]|nr:hypothetical protein [Bacteroidota bacterium]